MAEWIQTYTGRAVNPLKITADDIDIRDIAHSLSLTNRFTGHTPVPYSVAQHSVLVSDLCSTENALWGLLHDAPEAYLADISRPVKLMLKEIFGDWLKEIDTEIMHAVCDRFSIPYKEPAEVKRADDNALANEAFSFFGNTPNYKSWHHRFENGYEKLPYKVVPTDWHIAELSFLRTYSAIRDGERIGYVK